MLENVFPWPIGSLIRELGKIGEAETLFVVCNYLMNDLAMLATVCVNTPRNIDEWYEIETERQKDILDSSECFETLVLYAQSLKREIANLDNDELLLAFEEKYATALKNVSAKKFTGLSFILLQCLANLFSYVCENSLKTREIAKGILIELELANNLILIQLRMSKRQKHIE